MISLVQKCKEQKTKSKGRRHIEIQDKVFMIKMEQPKPNIEIKGLKYI